MIKVENISKRYGDEIERLVRQHYGVDASADEAAKTEEE